jgi:hypothetical protein
VEWGYPIVLTVMLLIRGVMAHYFKGKVVVEDF